MGNDEDRLVALEKEISLLKKEIRWLKKQWALAEKRRAHQLSVFDGPGAGAIKP